MNKTGIEYLDYSWNPIAMRCTPVSEGCANCWHLAMANRMAGNSKIVPELRAAYAGECKPELIASHLEEPGKLRKPSIIGAQFMGDLFHDAVIFSTIELIMKTVLHCPRHTFIFLTKRPQRMAEYFKWAAQNSNLIGFQPPSNTWLGVTAENQETADERIPVLLQIPAAVRFVSYEPALEAIDLQYWLDYDPTVGARPGIDFVIAGCESGPKRRPAKEDWFRQIRDQCIEAGIPFFLKQMEVDGKVVSMPELDGKVWKEWPK